MATLSSWVGNAGNMAHNALIKGAGYKGSETIIAGAGAGFGYGAIDATLNGSSNPLGEGFDTALKGAVVGAGARFTSSKYAEGAFRSTTAAHMGYTNPELAKRAGALSAQSHNFSISNFTQSKNTPFWNVNETAMNHLNSPDFMSKYKG